MPLKLSLSSWHFNIDEYLNPWLLPAPWKHVPRPISHFFGHREGHQKSVGNLVIIFWSFIGIFSSILLIEAVGHHVPSFQEHEAPIIVGSFGAAAVLEFYAIESPLAQPRNAILGQALSSIVGVAISKLFALSPHQSPQITWVAGSLACACAVSVMGLTGTVHPPAGATALLAVVDENIAGLGWFLLPVILLGCVLMQAVALLVNNSQRKFPNYWWTPEPVGQGWRHWRRRQHDVEEAKGESDTDAENGAAFKRIVSHRADGGEIKEAQRILITRGQVKVPDDMYLTPEERVFLEELSGRL